MTDAPVQWRGIAGLSSLLGMSILYQNISSSHLSQVVAYSTSLQGDLGFESWWGWDFSVLWMLGSLKLCEDNSVNISVVGYMKTTT